MKITVNMLLNHIKGNYFSGEEIHTYVYYNRYSGYAKQFTLLRKCKNRQTSLNLHLIFNRFNL